MDGISFVTTDESRWGAGTEAPLAANDVDMNNWTFLQRIKALEDGVRAIGVKDVEYDEETTSITFILDDDTPVGPFPLPTAELRFFSTWENNFTYKAGDLIAIDGLGIVKVEIAHTTADLPADFNIAAEDGEGNKLYRQVMGNIVPLEFDLSMSLNGPIPGDALPVMTYVAVRDMRLPADLLYSQFYLADAPTGALTFKLHKNGVEIGALHFEASSNVGSATFLAAVSFEPGDRLQILAPAVEDNTAGDLSVTFVAERL